MTQAPAAIFKIPHRIPTTARGKVNRARKTAATQPKAAGRTAGRVVGSETHAATRGDGEVIEPEHGITVYPPRQEGGRWRAAWHEDGERKQCESVSEEKLAGKLEKARQRIAMGAANMTKPGADLMPPSITPPRTQVPDLSVRSTCPSACRALAR